MTRCSDDAREFEQVISLSGRAWDQPAGLR